MNAGTVRDATSTDFAAIAAIAAQGDSEADEQYLGFLRMNGSLRVAVAPGDGDTPSDEVVAFGGVIALEHGVTMVTDLFVHTKVRGAGIGGLLLADLLSGAERTMTFSSKHAAAVPAYRRAGMTPSWRLLYLAGVSDHSSPATSLPSQSGRPWRGTRPELVRYWLHRGGVMHDGAVLLREPPTGDRDTVRIVRLEDARGADAFTDILRALPVGTAVTCCSPEHSPVAAEALARGFRIVDHDIFCASPGVTLPADLHCLDPGLV